MKAFYRLGLAVMMAFSTVACNSFSRSSIASMSLSADGSSKGKGPLVNLTGTVPGGTLGLAAGQSLNSGDLVLLMQPAGNLVLYRGGAPVWATNWFLGQSLPPGSPNGNLGNCQSCSAIFQADGNLVLYNGKVPYWTTGTSGNWGAVLTISDTAPFLSITSATGTVLWASVSANTGFYIPAGTSMAIGDLNLEMQLAGNLVLYKGTTPIWASNWFLGQGIPAGSANGNGNFTNCQTCFAVFQPADGNLVLYNGNTPYWATGTGGHPDASVSISETPPYLTVNNMQGSFIFSTGQTITQDAALTVTGTSSIVVMEYEAWFTSLHPLATVPRSYNPLLNSANLAAAGLPGYDSEDPTVIAQHMSWLQAMGVNAITAEQTNSGPCVMAYSNPTLCIQYMNRIGADPSTVDSFINYVTSIDNSTLNLYPALAASGTSIKLIPVLDGQDPEMYIPFMQTGTTGLATALDFQIQTYLNYMRQYPQLNVFYLGKPLFIMYIGGEQQPGVSGGILNLAQTLAGRYAGQLTIRLMASNVGSQPGLLSPTPGAAGLHQVYPNYQTWTWMDRLNSASGLFPSYTAAGSRVEAFTVSPATPGTIVNGNDGAWNSPDAGLFNGGATFNQYMYYAAELKPIFLFVNQFNEYAAPDQGVDVNHSNDLEPTQQWGFEHYNAAKAALLNYEEFMGLTLGAQ